MQITSQHLGLVQALSIKSGGLNFFLWRTRPPPSPRCEMMWLCIFHI